MSRKLAVTVLTLMLSASWGVGAQHAVGAPSRPLAEVRILPTSSLVDGGGSIAVKVRILCQPDGVDGIQWEGFAGVTQGDVAGWKELSLDCDGRQHVQFVLVPVSAEPGTAAFSTGTADVSVYILDENTLTQHATDGRTVKVTAGR